jgi:hypothetical protein
LAPGISSSFDFSDAILGTDKTKTSRKIGKKKFKAKKNCKQKGVESSIKKKARNSILKKVRSPHSSQTIETSDSILFFQEKGSSKRAGAERLASHQQGSHHLPVAHQQTNDHGNTVSPAKPT